MIDLNNTDKIYFVGIGGIAMSAAAGIAKTYGFTVSGSDSKEVYDPAKRVLDREKIPYFPGYNESHIKESRADLFVLSAGEDLNNPEVKYIYEHKLPHCSFPKMLKVLAEDRLRVVVAGTHGKSTTAGLLGHLFKNLDDSSFMVGAVLQNYETNFYRGDGHYFVFEGDEYKSEFDDPAPKFSYYKPDILVLTNLEFDHPDVFADVESMEREFELLIADMPEDGLIIYNADDPRLPKLIHKTNITAVSFGMGEEADFKAEEVGFAEGYANFRVLNKHSKDILSQLGHTEDYQTQLPGKMNVYNALAAIALLRTLGFGRDQIALDLLSYKGVKRRFEVVGEKNGITIIDDYAHHPTAVRETLEAARLRYFPEDAEKDIITLAPGSSNPGKEPETRGKERQGRLWAVFEPHTFSRTKAVLPELAKSFGAADEVLISEIYPAREKSSEYTITSADVVSRFIGSNGASGLSAKASAGAGKLTNYKTQNIRLVHDKREALDILKKEAKPGDVIVVMAVGSFNRLAYELKEAL
ncbi:MAG: Mur ligase family protein [Patescibacteria group bacterium]|nr:Mur ligase family protein [Patescibacteria group bacterium]